MCLSSRLHNEIMLIKDPFQRQKSIKKTRDYLNICIKYLNLILFIMYITPYMIDNASSKDT